MIFINVFVMNILKKEISRSKEKYIIFVLGRLSQTLHENKNISYKKKNNLGYYQKLLYF
jgi:hypothetical protein